MGPHTVQCAVGARGRALLRGAVSVGRARAMVRKTGWRRKKRKDDEPREAAAVRVSRVPAHGRSGRSGLGRPRRVPGAPFVHSEGPACLLSSKSPLTYNLTPIITTTICIN